ncbi:hypothetical protein GCG21_00580 [Pseudactinotalea sp. HY160]|nr:nucleotidyltransferase family protein [Pseudactinotalea sp. HY160]MPV48528.1 hypothetical protein [Pseudactinotalea sp. HY160]
MVSLRSTVTDRPPRRRARSALSHALVQIARGETPAIAPSVRARPEAFAGAVRYHRLAPLAHTLLRETAGDLARLVEDDRDRARATHLHMTTLVGALGDLFEDLPWVVFKGPVLSEVAHPVAGLRSYGDLDLLVAPGDLRTASARLLEAGWTIADFDDMLGNPDVPGEMHWRSPSGALMDLHWSMINTAGRRRRLDVPTARILERRVPIRLGFVPGWTLDPADTLIHVCLHAALTGANRLLYLVDAQRSAARVTDWAEVARRAAAWKAAPHVSLVLRRARSGLGGDLPIGLDRLLGSSPAFRALTGAVDRIAPVPGTRSEPGIARLVARAAQPGAARTALAASRGVARHVLQRDRAAQAARSGRADRVVAGQRALGVYLDRVEGAIRSS